MAAPPRRAEPPCAPATPAPPTTESRGGHRTAEGRERRSVVRGLILLALLVLILSIARAGLDRVFPHGWWRP